MTTSAGRRAEYAAATRSAILGAARDLFVEKGYFGTRVEDIARLARVAPATVYAVGGGKNGLLRTLIEDGTRGDDMPGFRAAISANTDPLDLLRFIVEGTRSMFELWSPLMRQVAAAAELEPAVRESRDMAYASLRDGLALIANRLAELGALRPGLSAADATDVLWFHLCNASYFTLTDDLGWPLLRAADWLREALTSALLAGR